MQWMQLECHWPAPEMDKLDKLLTKTAGAAREAAAAFVEVRRALARIRRVE